MEFKLRFLIMPDFIYSDTRLNATDIKVYSFINSYKGDKFYFTNDQLAEMFNTSDDSISRAMGRLAEYGYIFVDYEIKKGGGKIRFVRNRKSADSETATSLTKKPQHLYDKESKLKDNKLKEKDNGEVEAREILNHWNSVYKTKYKSTEGIKVNVAHWVKIHPLADIFVAIDKIKYHEFWADKMTPVILFRKKNPRGEAVDFVEEMLNLKIKGGFKTAPEEGKYAKFN